MAKEQGMLDADLKADSTLCEGREKGGRKEEELGGSILDGNAALKEFCRLSESPKPEILSEKSCIQHRWT